MFHHLRITKSYFHQESVRYRCELTVKFVPCGDLALYQNIPKRCNENGGLAVKVKANYKANVSLLLIDYK